MAKAAIGQRNQALVSTHLFHFVFTREMSRTVSVTKFPNTVRVSTIVTRLIQSREDGLPFPRQAVATLGQSTRNFISESLNLDFREFLKTRQCMHCRENPRVTYNDDDHDFLGLLDDTTLCTTYPQQCWFKKHNLILNRIECALSRHSPRPGQTASHGYSCPCVIPSKYSETSLQEDVREYLQFVDASVDTKF